MRGISNTLDCIASFVPRSVTAKGPIETQSFDSLYSIVSHTSVYTVNVGYMAIC